MNIKQNFDLSFLGKFIYQMFKTLELPAPLPGLYPGPTGGLKRPPDSSPNNFASPISNSRLRPCIARKASFYSFFGHIIKIENGIVPVNPTERILMKIDYFLSNLSNLINNLRIGS